MKVPTMICGTELWAFFMMDEGFERTHPDNEDRADCLALIPKRLFDLMVADRVSKSGTMKLFRTKAGALFALEIARAGGVR
jgi:hypothetical protein